MHIIVHFNKLLRFFTSVVRPLEAFKADGTNILHITMPTHCLCKLAGRSHSNNLPCAHHRGMILCLIASLLNSFGREVCYEPCGCFSNRKPFGDRPLPKSPESQDLKWYLLTRAQPDQKIPISSDRIP